MATRSVSISLEEGLLHQLDQELARGSTAGRQQRNRSAALSEALELWLQRQRLAALQQAYTDLAALEGGDLEAAGADAADMGAGALLRRDG